MKIIHTIATLLLLLSALTTITTNAITQNTQTNVLDISGKSLKKGIRYNILPAIRGRGGGLKPAFPRNATCPLDIEQARYDTAMVIPVTFSPADNKERLISLSTDLNIKFSAPKPLGCSAVWKLGGFDEDLKHWFVTIGGVEGNPGPKTLSNWFKIDKYDDQSSDIGGYYKLVFCPTVCNFCKVVCRDVSVFAENGVRRLVLTLSDTTPLLVKFKRA